MRKGVFLCLGHSNWTICSPLSPFCSRRFSTFFTFILGGQFLLPQRTNKWEREINPTSKLNETRVFQCLGHSNWTICNSLNPFCSDIFATFQASYWGAISYCPRGPIMGKGNSPNPRIGWDQWTLMPGAFKLDHLQHFAPFTFWKFG